ncbi:hypothetical protein H6A03_07105 [[Clostridium] spiroforme]|nr:hypothetical protein [Thomasclavelia spiroformis]MBM6881337.1 hypothetical protein [Thomasclavelia spiroformis]
MNDFYELKSLSELIEEIETGMDIECYIYGFRYNISWRNDKPFICSCPDGKAVFFDTVSEMMEEFEINGLPLKDVWHDIKIIHM